MTSGDSMGPAEKRLLARYVALEVVPPGCEDGLKECVDFLTGDRDARRARVERAITKLNDHVDRVLAVGDLRYDTREKVCEEIARRMELRLEARR